MARQGLRFGATNIVLNESFGRWRWRRGRRRRNCSTASVVQKINAQIAAPLGLSKKLPAQIVIVQKIRLEPRGRALHVIQSSVPADNDVKYPMLLPLYSTTGLLCSRTADARLTPSRGVA